MASKAGMLLRVLLKSLAVDTPRLDLFELAMIEDYGKDVYVVGMEHCCERLKLVSIDVSQPHEAY